MMSESALVPISPADLATVHARALPAVQHIYEDALVRAQTAQRDAEAAAEAARTSLVAAEQDAARTYAYDLDEVMLPSTVNEAGQPCCPCGKVLSRPGYCSDEHAKAAARRVPGAVQLPNNPLFEGGVLVPRNDEVVLMAEAEVARRVQTVWAAARHTQHVEASQALLRRGLSRTALRGEVARLDAALKAAAAHRGTLWRAAEARVKDHYVIKPTAWPWIEHCSRPCQHELCEDRRALQRLIHQEAGTAYTAALEAHAAAADALDVATAVWHNVLAEECRQRGVAPRPRLCPYCELVPLPAEKRFCSDGCERKDTQDGLDVPLPGINNCEGCWRSFRNPMAPACPVCSEQCLLSQSLLDPEPWLTVDFSHVVIVSLPKSAAERRRLGRQLKKLEAEAQAGRQTPARRVLPQTTLTAEERAEEGILAKLRGASEPLREEDLFEGLGIHITTARRVRARLVAAGRVVRSGAGTWKDPYRYSLPR
jgi:multidrug efflux pump subunit AcrA (membrane-fusion protein)